MKFNLCTLSLAVMALGASARPATENAKARDVVVHKGRGLVGDLISGHDNGSDDEEIGEESGSSNVNATAASYNYLSPAKRTGKSMDADSKIWVENVLTDKLLGSSPSATGSAGGASPTGSGSGSGSSSVRLDNSFFNVLDLLTEDSNFLTTQQGSLPASSGTSALSAVKTIAAGETFDGGMVMFDRGVSCTGQTEGGDSDAVFQLEEGASISNVIIGPNQIEGIHCQGGCTLTNVWWSAVCEDAFTIKNQAAGETTSISGGGAYGASDKVQFLVLP